MSRPRPAVGWAPPTVFSRLVADRRACLVGVLLGLIALGAAHPGDPPTTLDGPDRQVTIFGILLSPDRKSDDPRLLPIADQLRKLKPGNGFRLRSVATERLAASASLRCELGEGLEATATLLDAANDAGKVRLRFELRDGGQVELSTVVTTPPNQLFFCEKPLPDGQQLLIGVGAR